MASLNIFECIVDENTGDEIYYLLNKRGKKVIDAKWNSKPILKSGIFLHTDTKLFTVLGDEVKGIDADCIDNVINFWIIYRKDNLKFIGRLEPLGLKFKLKVIREVEDVGYLSHDGCVIKENGVWNIYTYSFNTLVLDTTKPNVVLEESKLKSIIKMGFTIQYLIYLCNELGKHYLMHALQRLSTSELWDEANLDFYKVVIKLSELVDEYSAEDIGRMLHLQSYIVSVISSYLEIYDFIES